MRLRFHLIGFVLMGLLASPCHGLAPHELVVLVNTESEVSREIGYRYARLRAVPASNVVALRVPPATGGGVPLHITPEAFREHIYDPARQALAERGLAGQIRAWLYAPGFPYRIDCPGGMSLTGITFMQGRVPGPTELQRALQRSPWFAGP